MKISHLEKPSVYGDEAQVYLLQGIIPNMVVRSSLVPRWNEFFSWSNGIIFPRYWPFVRGIHRSPVGDAELWCFFYLRLDTRANTGDAGDFGRHRAHYDVTIMCGAMGVIVGKKLTSMSLISAFGHTIICGLAQSQIMGVDTHNYPLQ